MKNPMRQLPDPASITPPNTYIGMRYVPIYGGEWDETKVYENLVMVSYEDNIYLSHKPVPSGINPASADYWVHMYATPFTPGPEPVPESAWDWETSESIGMLPNNPDINSSELVSEGISTPIVLQEGIYYFYSNTEINHTLLFSPKTVFKIQKGVKVKFNTPPVIVDSMIHFEWGDPGSTIDPESGVHLPPMPFNSNWFSGSFPVWVENGSYHLYHHQLNHMSVRVGNNCTLTVEGSGSPTITATASSTVEFKGFTFLPNQYPILTVMPTAVGSKVNTPTIRLTDVTIPSTSEEFPYFKIGEGNDVKFIIRNLHLKRIINSPIIWHNNITGSRMSTVSFDIDGITGTASGNTPIRFPLPVATTNNSPNWTADLNGYSGSYRNCSLTVPCTSDNTAQTLVWNMGGEYLFENVTLSEYFTGATGSSLKVTAINSTFGSREGFFNRVNASNVSLIDCTERTHSTGVARIGSYMPPYILSVLTNYRQTGFSKNVPTPFASVVLNSTKSSDAIASVMDPPFKFTDITGAYFLPHSTDRCVILSPSQPGPDNMIAQFDVTLSALQYNEGNGTLIVETKQGLTYTAFIYYRKQ